MNDEEGDEDADDSGCAGVIKLRSNWTCKEREREREREEKREKLRERLRKRKFHDSCIKVILLFLFA